MKVWQFSEQAYHPAFEVPGPMRVNLSHDHCDPVIAGQLLNRYLDEYCLADELGLDIMVNEHHQAATCMSTSCFQTLAILARVTKKARLLALGAPIGNRGSALRVAEEAAMVDCISGGRLELGLVKGAGYELFMSNQAPVRFMDKFWEAHDVILAAMTNQGDNFTWDGEYFKYRTVSLWPRPIQQPPPVWMTSSSAGSAAVLGKRGYVCTTFLSGSVARSVFTGYRTAYKETFGEEANDDRLGYLCLVCVGDTYDKAYEKAEHMRGYFDTMQRVSPQFRNPTGFSSYQDNFRALTASGNAMRPRMRNGELLPQKPTIEQYSQAGLMFVGTPDQVYQQIADFNTDVGGFGNLMVMGQAGTLSHEDTVDNLTLLAKEVAPRLAELKPVDTSVKFETFA